jgi:hypothetical protein
MTTIPRPEPHGHGTQRQLRRWIVFSFALGALSIGLSMTVHRMGNLPGQLRYPVVALAIVLIGFWVRTAIHFQRSLDEMQRRVFLETTSIVGIAALAWVYLFPVLEKTGLVGPLTHDGYAAAVVPLTLIAWFVTVRRHQ